MKRIVSFGATLRIFGAGLLLLTLAAIPLHSQTNQLLQGTEVRLTLTSGLTTAVARSGDPFTAVVAAPVMNGNQVVLPAGTRVTGVVGGVIHTRHFALLRGQAAMSLKFRSMTVGDHEVPIRMSVMSIRKPSEEADELGGKRKDVKLEEGEVVREKPDITGTVLDMAIGTGGGTVVGFVFSHAVRGFGIGMAGSAAYVLSKKGKEVKLPADTTLLVRMDSTVELPRMSAEIQGGSGGGQ
jgi:hypothetical protein